MSISVRRGEVARLTAAGLFVHGVPSGLAGVIQTMSFGAMRAFARDLRRNCQQRAQANLKDSVFYTYHGEDDFDAIMSKDPNGQKVYGFGRAKTVMLSSAPVQGEGKQKVRKVVIEPSSFEEASRKVNVMDQLQNPDDWESLLGDCLPEGIVVDTAIDSLNRSFEKVHISQVDEFLNDFNSRYIFESDQLRDAIVSQVGKVVPPSEGRAQFVPNQVVSRGTGLMGSPSLGPSTPVCPVLYDSHAL